MRKEVIYINNILKNISGSIYWKDVNGVYLGCNQMEADMVGVQSPELLIGKTDYDLPWRNIADVLRETDRMIMQTEIPEEIIETPTLADGKCVVMLTKKSPLYDNLGNVIGIIGVSIDITDRKRAEELELQNKMQENAKVLAEQVAHDIRSPLAALSMLAKSCKNLSEKEHALLNHTITTVRKIADDLLERYEKDRRTPVDGITKKYVSVRLGLQEVISNKRCQYRTSNLSFNYSYDIANNFAFIKGDYFSFFRMMSNLLNNSAESIECKKGIIEVGFSVKDNKVEILVKDNGNGMSQEVVDKLMCNVPISSTKQRGFGIGTQQIMGAVQAMNGKMLIKSIEKVGTEITLVFPESDPPEWLAMQIVVHKGDLVIVLDSDPLIHDMWKSRFVNYSNDLVVMYFTNGAETIDFINSLDGKDTVFLLAGYELRNQDITGVDVIEKCLMQHQSVLLTSIYTSQIIDFDGKCASIKMLYRSYIDIVPLIVEEKSKVVSDLVFIDDSELFTDALRLSLKERGMNADIYSDVNSFLDNLQQYSKDTKIVTDYELKNGIDGIYLSKKLYELGYTRLYMLSGRDFEQQDIPPYLTIVPKNIGNIEKLLDLNTCDFITI